MNFRDMIFKLAEAIQERKLMLVCFRLKSTGEVVKREVAPLDYSLSQKPKYKEFKVHFWDFGTNDQGHPLSLTVEQIIEMEILAESFKPEEFITWNVKKAPWMICRDWGSYS